MWWDSPQWQKVESFFPNLQALAAVNAPPPWWLHDEWGTHWGAERRKLALSLGADPVAFDAAWAAAVVVSKSCQRLRS